MGQNYWNSKGKYQHHYNELNKRIPVMGAVEYPRSKNKKLERLRVMANCYYDIFNNGGGNRGAQIRYYFGPEVCYLITEWNRRFRNRMSSEGVLKRIHDILEPIMDEAIIQAAQEQGI